MAKAVACALKDGGFNQGYIIARNATRGRELAALYGLTWRADLNDLQPELPINATPTGMAGSVDADGLSFSQESIAAASVIFDVVALPELTPLVRIAHNLGKVIITGAQVFAIQAVEQFVLYTGMRPSDALFREAAEYARESKT